MMPGVELGVRRETQVKEACPEERIRLQQDIDGSRFVTLSDSAIARAVLRTRHD